MEAMQPIAAVVSVLGTILFFALLSLMGACLVYLIRARQDETLPEMARKSGIAMVASYFAGLALFFAANAVPNEIGVVKMLAAGVSVIGIGAVPAVTSALLLARRTLPKRARPFAVAIAFASALLFFCLTFAVWIAFLAQQSFVTA